MTHSEARQLAGELSGKLTLYQRAYYVDGRPLVTDAEYDRLFDRLAALEKEFPDLARDDSPTRRVGSDLTQDLPEVAHSIPVLSLDKAYTAGDVDAWIGKTARNAGAPLSFVCEEKIDGASIVLYYEQGVLARAVTRGNGEVGNDVTGNVRTVRSVPLRLAEPATVAVRGEIFLARSRFAEVNAAMEEPYANPRNLAAGTLRRVKSSEVASVPLEIYVYEGFFAEQPATHRQVLERMAALGLRLDPRVGFFSDTVDLGGVRAAHPGWTLGPVAALSGFLEAQRAGRRDLDYDIDGIVIKVDEMPAREALGYTGHHPRWAIAFKFEPPEGATTVKAIEAQVGRTGRVTPVARVEPVQISGATISNVTLHNQEYIDMLELAVGDRVAVSRRGDVIPAVERVLEKNESGNTVWKLPATCPSCGGPLEKQGAHHFCTNPACPDQVRGRLAFFVARDQMDIEGLGPETVDALLQAGLVRDVQDIYTFDPDRLLALPGFGEKKVAAIREGIANSRRKAFRTVFQSLGIPDIGPKVTELLAQAGWADIDALLSLAEAGDPAPLLAIHGIGERTASTLIKALRDTATRARIEGLRAAGLHMREDAPPRPAGFPQTFAGQTWCVTGSFRSFSPREKAMEEVTRRGGRVTGSVTSKTTHLLAGENPGSKLAKAAAAGARIVTEEEFLALLQNNT